MLEVAELLGIDIDIHVEDQSNKLKENVADLFEETPLPENADQNIELKGVQRRKIVADEDKSTLEVGEEEGTIQCNLCSNIFSTKPNLRRHKRMNHSVNVSLFKCTIPGCSFSTKQKSRLKEHKATKHDGVRFNCANCQFQTSWREALGKHIESKHDKIGFPWPCDLCTFKGLNEGELGSHTKIKHNNILNVRC